MARIAIRRWCPVCFGVGRWRVYWLAAETRCKHHAFNGQLDDYELSFEGGERLRGKFLVARLDYAGDFNGERSYTLALESSGQVESL